MCIIKNKNKNYTLIDYLILRLKEAGEIIIKTISDYWVIGKLSNLREFFVVIQQKSASIIEIDGEYKVSYAIELYDCLVIFLFVTDEVKRLCEKQLKSIFFH